jgi:hypothetical protein
MFIPVDTGDDDDVADVVDSISITRILSLLNLGVDDDSSSMQGISSIICLGVDSRLIIDDELNIFGGESNVFIVSDDLNIWPFVFVVIGKDFSNELCCFDDVLLTRLLFKLLLFGNDLID